MKSSRRIARGTARLTATLMLTMACERAERLTAPDNSAVMAAIAQLGFDTRGVVDRGDYVIVEGDIALPKDQLLSAMRRSQRSSDATEKLRPTGPRYQWLTDTIVSQANIANIKVDLSNIAGDVSWTNAARAAMAEWNGLPGSEIFFSEGSPADITISFGYIQNAPDFVAVASWPTGSPAKPGPTITINTGFQDPLNAAQKLRNMVHELGHTLGLRHTNWANNPCVNPLGGFFGNHSEGVPPGAHQIYGTPQFDASSIMNGCTATASWAGFSHYDSVAATWSARPTLVETNVTAFPC